MRYGGHTPCIEVELAHHARVIFDAGTGARALGQRMRETRDTRGARPIIPLVLSHRHSDHVIGLAHLMPLIAGTHRVRIACHGVDVDSLHSLVTQQLSEPLFPSIDGVADSVEMISFDARDVLALGGSCRVRSLPAHHPGGASILCVEDDQGLVAAYAPDNELAMDRVDESLTVWRRHISDALLGVPLLLHDSTYLDDELAMHRGWGHSSAEESTRFAIACQAKVLVLFHHHPDRTDDEIDAIVLRCRELAARAGSSLEIHAAAERVSFEVN